MAKFDESIERAAAAAARTKLKGALISQIRQTFHRGKSGAMEKSTVTSKFKDGRLDRLVINSPHYSFKLHYGSTLTGTQGASTRRGGTVKSFTRHLSGKNIQVKAHDRKGGDVTGFNKNRRYGAHNHLSRALKQTDALQKLATDLGQNRIVAITSQINF